MKLIRCLLLTLSCFPLLAFCQSEEIDSLKRMLSSDITKQEQLKAIIQIAANAMYEEEDTVHKYVDLGLALTKEESDLSIQASIPELLKLKGTAPLVRIRLKEALPAYKQAIEEYKRVINLYAKKGSFQEKETYWSLLKGMASTTNNIGLVYYLDGDYDSTIFFYQKAIEISEPIKEAPFEGIANRAKTDIATTMDNVALIYKDKDEFETSLSYSIQAENLLRELDREKELSGVLINKGNSLTRLKRYDEALESFSTSHELALKVNSDYQGNLALHGLGFTYVEMGEFEKALPPLLETRSRWIEKNDLEMIISNSTNLATCYLKLKQYQKALEMAQTISPFVDTLGRLERKVDFERFKSDFYSELALAIDKIEYYDIAIKSARQQQTYKDSLYTLEKDKQFEELQTQYETEKKQDLINTQQAALAQEAQLRNALIGGSFLLIAVIGLVVRNARLKTRSLTEKESLLKEIHHRVKNNLQVISSLLNMQSREANDPEMLDVIKEGQSRVKAMSLIHQKLYQTENLSEIDFEDYATQLIDQLASLYKKDGLEVSKEVDAKDIRLDIDTAIPLGLILNELISNSFKYAFKDLEKGEISISLQRLSKEDLKLTVSDNGIGLPSNVDFSKVKSLGLKLVNILTKQLKGSLETHSGDGTSFEIQFKDQKMIA